jgi:hypothetical protein
VTAQLRYKAQGSERCSQSTEHRTGVDVRALTRWRNSSTRITSSRVARRSPLSEGYTSHLDEDRWLPCAPVVKIINTTCHMVAVCAIFDNAVWPLLIVNLAVCLHYAR